MLLFSSARFVYRITCCTKMHSVRLLFSVFSLQAFVWENEDDDWWWEEKTVGRTQSSHYGRAAGCLEERAWQLQAGWQTHRYDIVYKVTRALNHEAPKENLYWGKYMRFLGKIICLYIKYIQKERMVDSLPRFKHVWPTELFVN